MGQGSCLRFLCMTVTCQNTMKRLETNAIAKFQRDYRFTGGQLRRVKIATKSSGQVAILLELNVRQSLKDLGSRPETVRLRLRLDGVEEFRFQKRIGTQSGRIPEGRIGVFEGMIFINLDAFVLLPGEVPKIHDYRASDAYIAARELWWEIVDRPKPQS